MRFPTPYSILMLVIALAASLTWVLPAGRYDTLRYDEAARSLVVTRAIGEETLPPAQTTLDRLGVQIRVADFLEGRIRKPVSIPGTYHRVESRRQGIVSVFQAPVLGVYDAVDVILFVLVIGGFIGVFTATGSFEAGMQALAARLRGRESWLIAIVLGLISLGGTTYGMSEETLAFYPLLVPAFVAAGYDAMVPLAAIFVGSSVGTMVSTTNPFSTIVASDAAGISWTTGLAGRIAMWAIATGVCIAYVLRYGRRVKAVRPSATIQPANAAAPMPARDRLLLVLFGTTIVVMVAGVSQLGWWLPEITTLFLVAALVAGLIHRPGERAFVEAFLGGARNLLGVALIVGIARGVTILLDRGEVSGSLLYYSSRAVEHLPGVPFIVSLLFIYVVLGFFIHSTSGVAVLTMPIIGPLAETAHVPREHIVNAYLFGIGLSGFVAPTGLLLASLAMVNVNFNVWIRFVLPLVGLLTVLSALFLALGVLL